MGLMVAFSGRGHTATVASTGYYFRPCDALLPNSIATSVRAVVLATDKIPSVVTRIS